MAWSVTALVCLLLGCWSLSTHGAPCMFSIPATGSEDTCDSYDLTKLEALGKVAFQADSNNYTLSVCEDVPSSSVPAPCKNGTKSSVAYQYAGNSCYSLGDLESTMAFPLDPSNSTRGIRVVYTNGDTGNSATWPRAVIYDFVCDKTVTDEGKPLSVLEYPAYTYTVRWPTSHACPVKRDKGNCALPQFAAKWDMLRFRPRPSWFDDAKFGIFIHWGMFSVPAFKTEWYWKQLMDGNPEFVEFHNRVYGCSGVMPDKFPCTGPNFTFPEFAPMFKAEMYDPDEWADLFKKAGAQYVVLTSKHHEGWCNFPNSYHWNWNSMDVGPKRDLVGDLTNSVRAAGLHMGLYHSLREWFNPLYLEDNQPSCSTKPTTLFPDEVLLPTLKEMVMQYKPEVIWADGAGDSSCTKDSVEYWKAPDFLSWLYNESPVKETVLANSRWGHGAIGDYQTGGDRFSPGKILPYKWESCYTIQHSSWGYDRTEGITGFWNTTFLINQLVSSVSCNGNLLLNVGPTADGRILPAFQERLLEMGEWLSVNGEAIYNTVPWRAQNDTSAKDVWYTASKDGNAVYAISFRAPIPGKTFVLRQPKTTASTKVTLLGYGSVTFTTGTDGMEIKFPSDVALGQMKYAWTFKLEGVQ